MTGRILPNQQNFEESTMQIFIFAVVAIIFLVVAGIILAMGSSRLDEAVQRNRQVIEKQNASAGYNMALTMGYEIPVDADFEAQWRAARVLAAKRAASMPRGANMGIGRLGRTNEFKTAWRGVDKDPLTAVKIAEFHGWDGLQTGAAVIAPAAPPPTTAPSATGKKIELVPGKDYPVIEITDDMSPADVRKARVANAKAKSAAMKAAKAAASAAPAPVPTASAAPAAPTAAAVNIPEPQLIEITPDMSPDEVRKARIANSKAKSAYKKALKAADAAAPTAAASPAASTAPSPPPTAEPAPIPANVPPPPELVAITDSMSPAEIRSARIANSKAKSAYKKALKEAGIDPQSVKI